MKSKELIRRIMEADPSGEEEVCIGNADILCVQKLPAYYDGTLQLLERDPNNKFYNVIGAKYKIKGLKISIEPHSIQDAICDDPNLPIDYSELPEITAARYKAMDDKAKQEILQSEQALELKIFTQWVEKQYPVGFVDPQTGEDPKAIANRIFKEYQMSRYDPLPGNGKVPPNKSYQEARFEQWDSMFYFHKIFKKGVIDDGVRVS